MATDEQKAANAAYMKKWLASKTQEERDAFNKARYDKLKAKGVTPAQKLSNAERARRWRAKMSPERREKWLAWKRDYSAKRDRPIATEAQKARRRELANARHQSDPRKKNDQALRDRAKRKLIILAAYGQFCACCGENELEFLSIDHIKGDGAEHRKLTKHSGDSLYNWLIANGFPPGYQTLCYNCNLAKRQGPECPHKRIVMTKMNLSLIRGGVGG